MQRTAMRPVCGKLKVKVLRCSLLNKNITFAQQNIEFFISNFE
jgi:hypothetical protein